MSRAALALSLDATAGRVESAVGRDNEGAVAGVVGLVCSVAGSACYGVSVDVVAGAARFLAAAAVARARLFYVARATPPFGRRVFEDRAASYGSPNRRVFGVADDGVTAK